MGMVAKDVVEEERRTRLAYLAADPTAHDAYITAWRAHIVAQDALISSRST